METSAIEAINRLSIRWAGAAPPTGPAVFSAACAWPLVGLLAAAASGSVRDELREALGVPAEAAHDLALDVLHGLSGLPGVGAALGLWARGDLPLRPEWTEALPPGVVGRLSGDAEVDTRRLDTWASDNTGGLIDRMPVAVRPSTVLVLATALALRTRWTARFTDVPLAVSSGPWAGLGTLAGLRRATADLDDVTVLDTPGGPITRLRLEGDNGLDIHLLLGPPERSAREILAAGQACCLRGESAGVAGSRLALGARAPGLTVEEALGPDPRPELAVQAVRFTVRAGHDLLESPVLGLRAAAEPGDRFPGISPDPLYVSQARQDAMATFSSQGFEAAAVTAAAMIRAAFIQPGKPRKTLRVVFDRPFGFFAAHRDSGLILAAGWVTDPERA